MNAFKSVSPAKIAMLAVAGFALSLTLGVAAPANGQVIGIAMSSVPGGDLNVDGLGAAGNVNLTEGARIQTGDAPVRIRLSNGARVTLQTGSQARVFTDHILVEQGSAVASTKGYLVQTSQVKAAPAAAVNTKIVPQPNGKVAAGAAKPSGLASQALKPVAPNAAKFASNNNHGNDGHGNDGGFGDHGGAGGHGGDGDHGGFGHGGDGDHGGFGHGGDGDHGGFGHGGDGDHDGGHDGGHDGDHDDHGDHHHHHHHCPPISRP